MFAYPSKPRISEVDLTSDKLSEAMHGRVCNFIEQTVGIKLPASKRTMLEGRLSKRARSLGLGSISEYCRFLFDENGLATEAVELVDAVTTNKTDFFREPDHFTFLTERAVPALLRHRGGEPQPHLKIWSAASSTGAEAYTIAMVLAEHARKSLQKFRFSILGTDISTSVLRQARRAIYPEEMINPISRELQLRYLMFGRTAERREVRIAPELRACVTFAYLNLMDTQYPVDRNVDVIFLRNVLIYFDKPTQLAVVQRLVSHLRKGGYIIFGHSETMVGVSLPLKQLAPSVFQAA